jgi:hypothetical protein
LESEKKSTAAASLFLSWLLRLKSTIVSRNNNSPDNYWGRGHSLSKARVAPRLPFGGRDISHRLGQARIGEQQGKTSAATINSRRTAMAGRRPIERRVGPARLGPPFEEESGWAFSLPFASLRPGLGLAFLGGLSPLDLRCALKQALDKHSGKHALHGSPFPAISPSQSQSQSASGRPAGKSRAVASCRVLTGHPRVLLISCPQRWPLFSCLQSH